MEPKHVVGLALPQRSQAAPDKLSRGKLAHQRGAVLHRQRHHKHDVGVLHHGKAAQHAAPLEANVLVLGAVRRHLAHARHADNLLPIRGNHIVVRVPRRDEGHHIVNQVLLPALPGRLQRHPLDKVAVDGLELRLKVLLDRRGGPHAPPNVAHHSQGGGVLELERHKAPGKRPHVLRSGRTRIVHWRGPHAVGAGAGRIPRGRGRLVRGRGWLVRGRGWLVRSKGWLVRGRGWLVRSRGLVLRSRGPVLRSRGRLVHSRASSQIVQRALVHPPLHRHPVVAPRLHAKPRHKLGTRLHPHASQDPPSPILEAAARIQRVLALPSKHLHTAQLTEALERARLHAGSGFDAVPPQTAARHAGKGQAGMGDALVNRVHHGKVELVPQRPSIHGDGTRIAARPRGGAQVLDELHNHLSRAILGKKPLRIVVAHGNVEGGPQSLHLASVARESLGNLLADPLHLDIQGIQRAVQVVVLAQQETHFARQQVVGPGKPVVAKFLVRLAVLKELEHLLPHLLLASADFVVLSLPLQSANLKRQKKNNPKNNNACYLYKFLQVLAPILVQDNLLAAPGSLPHSHGLVRPLRLHQTQKVSPRHPQGGKQTVHSRTAPPRVRVKVSTDTRGKLAVHALAQANHKSPDIASAEREKLRAAGPVRHAAPQVRLAEQAHQHGLKGVMLHVRFDG